MILCVFWCTYWPVAHLLCRNVYSEPFLIFWLCYLFWGFFWAVIVLYIVYIQGPYWVYDLFKKKLHSYFLIFFFIMVYHQNIFTKNFCVWILLCYWEDMWGFWGFSGGTSGKEPALQCRRYKRPKSDPWVRTIPCRRAWQPTPTFLTGESPGLWSLVGYDP